MPIAFASAVLMFGSTTAHAAVDPALRCQAMKLSAAGREVTLLMACYGGAARRGLAVNAICVSRAHSGLSATFARAERLGGCLTTNDATAVSAAVDASVGRVVARLWPTPTASSCVTTKLAGAAQKGSALLSAYSYNRTKPDAARLLGALARARQRLRATFTSAERRTDCQSRGDSEAIDREMNGLAGIAVVTLQAGPQLRELANADGVLIGTALEPDLLTNEPPYAATSSREFSYVTPENAMKWGPIQPAADTWNFGPADALMRFAEAHDMRIKGHALLWHQQLPAYVNNGMTPTQLQDAVTDHILTLVGYYRGRVRSWDVVNEAVNDAGTGLRPTIFSNKLGPGFIAVAFQLAHQADPDAILNYNDYNAEWENPKSDYIYNLVQGLLQQGVPIHGIGLQTHIAASNVSPGYLQSFQANIQRFVNLGLRVNISEMDVRIFNLPAATKFDTQRQVYHDVIAVCLAVAGCEAVTFWGFTDKYSWIDSFFGPDDALPFDDLYAPKPAYVGVSDALREAVP